jgi:hypothetical protein
MTLELPSVIVFQRTEVPVTIRTDVPVGGGGSAGFATGRRPGVGQTSL